MEAAIIAIAALACPIGMGLMMWFMAKGMRGRDGAQDKPAADDTLDGLRREHERIGAEIERADRDRARAGA